MMRLLKLLCEPAAHRYPAEWEVKEDLALLKQLELVETRGHGRGAYWRLVNH